MAQGSWTFTLQVDKVVAQPNEPINFIITWQSSYPYYVHFVQLYFGDGAIQQWVIDPPATSWGVMTQHAYASEGQYLTYAEAEVLDVDLYVAHITRSNEIWLQILVPAPVPPPPTLPPPPTPTPVGPPVGPPVVIILEPPDETPRPVVLPPPVEPPGPIDWRPGPLPPDVTPPPRTRETDVFTLRQFAAKWGHQVDRYALNVPLDGGEVVEDLPEPYRSFWQRLTTHKADIVFERRGIVYVAEIKPRLSRGAIGEAITAHELFKRLYRFPQETRAAVICQTAHPTLIQTAGWLDVLVYVTEQVDTGQPAGLYRRIGR
jgi:hypothetical protein